MFIFV